MINELKQIRQKQEEKLNILKNQGRKLLGDTEFEKYFTYYENNCVNLSFY